MKARIEELAAKTTSQISWLLGDDTESIVRAALETAVRETREEDSDKCEQMALYTGVDCAAAIRRLGEE